MYDVYVRIWKQNVTDNFRTKCPFICGGQFNGKITFFFSKTLPTPLMFKIKYVLVVCNNKKQSDLYLLYILTFINTYNHKNVLLLFNFIIIKLIDIYIYISYIHEVFEQFSCR